MKSAKGTAAFIKNIAIDCKSKEEAKRLLSILDGQGYRWVDLIPIQNENKIEVYFKNGSYFCSIPSISYERKIISLIEETRWDKENCYILCDNNKSIITKTKKDCFYNGYDIRSFSEFKIAYDYFYRNV